MDPQIRTANQKDNIMILSQNVIAKWFILSKNYEQKDNQNSSRIISAEHFPPIKEAPPCDTDQYRHHEPKTSTHQIPKRICFCFYTNKQIKTCSSRSCIGRRGTFHSPYAPS